MSILAGLTAPFRLAGIIGLSSWLLLSGSLKDYLPKENANAKTPIWMGHGDADPLVLHAWAETSQKRLGELGYDVSLKTYRYGSKSLNFPMRRKLAHQR